MENNLIVFDMDDVLWDLDGKAAKMADIDFDKLHTFSVYDNQLLTDNEKERLLAAYLDIKLYEDIVFDEQMIKFVNEIYHKYPQYPVNIVSNCATQEIKEYKMPQLLKVLELPEEKIRLNVIDMKTQTKQKKFPDGVFILVDDSPHNIVLSDAIHRIMPAKPYNDVLTDGYLNGFKIDRTKDTEETISTIMRYIKGR